MAVTHSTAIRNQIADLVCGELDAGTLELQTSGDVEVATLVFSNPAFQAASSGQATANSISPDASSTGGTIAKAAAKTSGGTTIFSFTIGTGGSGDLNVSNLTIGSGDQVSLSNFAYVAPL